MRIEKDMKLADVILHDFNLIPVINRFGIRLGFGDSTIGQICRKQKINTEFFLIIINTYHDPQYFPTKHLQSFPVSALISYLGHAHQYYLDRKMPAIRQLINQLVEAADDTQKKKFKLALGFFEEYQDELINHIKREEDSVYPYALEMEQVLETGNNPKEILHRMENYSITDYEEEHENVEEKLFDLKNLIIKYLPALENDMISYRILLELFDLEKDLRDHARIEDMILVPKVEAMEFAIKKMNR